MTRTYVWYIIALYGFYSMRFSEGLAMSEKNFYKEQIIKVLNSIEDKEMMKYFYYFIIHKIEAG